MPKLFVAVDLPAAVTAELALLQPPRTAGVRLAKRGQMHLTLHYIGKAGVARIADALEAVKVPAFTLAFEGVGQFPSAGGTATLWAGVRENPEFLGLHAPVAAALAGEVFRPEARHYTPHVTIARCEPAVPARVVDEFLAVNEGFLLSDVPVAGFGLYSSAPVGGVPVYRRQRSFELLMAEDEAGA
jgi:2'-5' RNA ligase